MKKNCHLSWTRYTLGCCAAVLLAACSADEPSGSAEQPLGVPLQLSSSISTAVTRAYNTFWEANDGIGVFTTFAGTSTLTYSGSDTPNANIKYYTNINKETDNNGTPDPCTFAPSVAPIYLPASGQAVDVFAYWPHADYVSATVPLNILVPFGQDTTGEEEDDMNDSIKHCDVLKVAKFTTDEAPIDIDHPSTQLLFEHAMTKVIVYVMAGTGMSDNDLAGSNVKRVVLLGQPRVATYAPVSQALTITAVTANDGTAPIRMKEVTSSDDPDYVSTYTKYNDATPPVEEWTKNVLHVYRAIVLPTNTTTNPASNTARKIQFNVGQTTYTYTITDAFAPGSQMIFAVRLSATNLEVEAVIKDWSHVTVTPNPLEPDTP